jgi:uncharacterized protein YprB with RNaseH-like and TPR domain
LSADLAARLARLHGRSSPFAGPASPGAEAGSPVSDAADGVSSQATRPSLAERVARLRVRAAQIDAAAPSDADVARLVGGSVVAPMLVEVPRTHTLPLAHGRTLVPAARDIVEGMRLSAGLQSRPEAASLLFLDTETSGLGGGTGTLAFLVGAARICGESIHVVQWLLTGFGGEAALLARVQHLLDGAAHLVTFNGKSFDLPLLRTRARLAGRPLCADEPAHLDLLHVTRRRLREGWADCRLRTAEEEALGFDRIDDLPGAEVPAAWQRWLQRRDPSLLPRILDHNREDLLSLAALLAVLAGPTGREAPLLRSAGVLGPIAMR